VDIADDIAPYEWLAGTALAAVMTAHVAYTRVDALPASFSRWWLRDELRRRIGFAGAVFSDDLSMAAAAVMGDMESRAASALAAGCDMILVCNDRSGACRVVEALSDYCEPVSQARLVRLHGRGDMDRQILCGSGRWRAACETVAHLMQPPDLVLDGEV
jgi:beta-N-acetylhexosaminidase